MGSPSVRRCFQEILGLPSARPERTPGDAARPIDIGEAAIASYEATYAEPLNRGDYLFALGRYDEAAVAYATVRDIEHAATALVRRARSLRLSGRAEAAVALLIGTPPS
jgi:hypothetical protein